MSLSKTELKPIGIGNIEDKLGVDGVEKNNLKRGRVLIPPLSALAVLSLAGCTTQTQPDRLTPAVTPTPHSESTNNQPQTPKETPLPTNTPTSTPTLTPTLTPTSTPTPKPTETPTPIPTIEVGGLSIPDPRITNPELFDLKKDTSPIPQFVNAMKMGGIGITEEEVAQRITYQQRKDKDGNPFVVAVFNLDPDPNQKGETLEGPIPLMVWTKEEGWEELQKSIAANLTGVESGTLVEWYRTEKDPNYLTIIKKDSNHISLNTEFHWKYLRPEKNQLSNWELTTKITPALRFAENNNMKVDIEGLTWGKQSSLPDWLLKGNYTQDELKKILETHIREVLTRYKGKFHRVNVISEPFGNPWETSFWSEKLGLDNYVRISFRVAREADPNAVLTIVDINDSDKLFELVRRLNEEELSTNGRKLIDAVGWEMPFFLPGSNTNIKDYLDEQRRIMALEQFRQSIRRYREIGVDVYITESLIDITDFPGNQEEKLKLQAEIYAHIQRILIEEKVSFTTYSFCDDPSIYPQGAGRPNANPYPRDRQRNPKPAYYLLLRELIFW